MEGKLLLRAPPAQKLRLRAAAARRCPKLKGDPNLDVPGRCGRCFGPQASGARVACAMLCPRAEVENMKATVAMLSLLGWVMLDAGSAAAQAQVTQAPAPPPAATYVAPPTPPVSPAPQTIQPEEQHGQWVKTEDSGWIWVPDETTTYDVDGVPYAYLYTPVYGWTWYASPWGFGPFVYGPWISRPWPFGFRAWGYGPGGWGWREGSWRGGRFNGGAWHWGGGRVPGGHGGHFGGGFRGGFGGHGGGRGGGHR
jgi:hypothetical protein